jgi:DNA gyrase subunit A
MDILPSQVVEAVQAATEIEGDDDDETLTAANDSGPWVLVIASSGLGKRVPVSKFRLQNRAGLGLKAIKFRKEDDTLAALRVVSDGDELMLVTNRGIIIRQRVNDISIQSRLATGVRLQRLDGEDAIAAVAVVPPTLQDPEGDGSETISATEAANSDVDPTEAE